MAWVLSKDSTAIFVSKVKQDVPNMDIAVCLGKAPTLNRKPRGVASYELNSYSCSK